MSIFKLTTKLRALLGLPVNIPVPSISTSATKGSIELQLAALLKLSVHSASLNGAKDFLSVEDSVRHCVEQTEKAQSYCSYILRKDRTQEDLKRRGYVFAEWRLDFVCPDKYHIMQGVWLEDLNDVLFDEWITLGKEHYTCQLVWLRADDGLDYRPHRILLVEKYLEILSRADLTSARMYHYRNVSYLLVEYRVTELPTVFSEIGGPTKGVFNISIWVNASTALIAKAVVASEDQREFEQVFTAYNEEVVVKQPHIGMKPTPGQPGSYTVTDNRRFPSPFHE